MANFVNEEKFFKWYKDISGKEIKNKSELLNETLSVFSDTGKATYTISAKDSVSGKEESYDYRVENMGCCGASTIWIYF